ncbi:hypothetical protein BIV60_18370 [Bacillus sp. MUM 116]|uniref:hypothetical protein n=1 Tax=Bacillus sp. MUM 116 TaxID=1678002 RepID=UPI0008F5B25C|nr:hypothetical protein [Bacillus sp. MUM 116]OIK11281.1 hypothetical protein BIV60_18370 [Bacillus sp. MUM 116]
MKNSTSSEIKRGQALSFRIPSDTPDHLVKQLQLLKEHERRNFSSKIADFVMQGVASSYAREKETVTIPLPHKLNKSQRDWLKHEHSLALLGSILHHLLSDPVRSTALLATLNSSSVDIDEALYLQEDLGEDPFPVSVTSKVSAREETASAADDDLSAFEWETASQGQPQGVEQEKKEEAENSLEDLLGDFLSSMNK